LTVFISSCFTQVPDTADWGGSGAFFSFFPAHVLRRFFSAAAKSCNCIGEMQLIMLFGMVVIRTEL
jgi:hypothetical protein